MVPAKLVLVVLVRYATKFSSTVPKIASTKVVRLLCLDTAKSSCHHTRFVQAI